MSEMSATTGTTTRSEWGVCQPIWDVDPHSPMLLPQTILSNVMALPTPVFLKGGLAVNKPVLASVIRTPLCGQCTDLSQASTT